MRSAVWENAATGTVFLHVPKAAGSSFWEAQGRGRIPCLNYYAMRGAHTVGCRCGDSACRLAIAMEEEFLRNLRPGQRWTINFGHHALTVHDAMDIPPEMPIVVPLRPNDERIVSVLRFDLSRYSYAKAMQVLLTPRVSFCWSPGKRTQRYEAVLWGDKGRAEILELIQLRESMKRYVGDDARTVLWRAWATDALRPTRPTPFWYAEMLPGLTGPDDPRWQRLHPIPMQQLGAWTEETFGVKMGHVNRSGDGFGAFDVVTATAELRAAADTYTAHDAATWDLLQVRLGDRAPAR